MSDAGITGGADQPPVKKQKCDDDETGTINVGGPMEDEATARQKLEEIGFDPDKVDGVITYAFSQKLPHIGWQASPMVHFCRAGDLTMCRFLLAKGAPTTEAPLPHSLSFPMMAAVRGGQLDVCKWLYDHGAASDVSTRLDNDRSSLWFATRSVDERHFEIGKWLILKGALCVSKGSSNLAEFDANAMVMDMAPRHVHLLSEDIPDVQTDTRRMYLSWAEGALSDHKHFFTFLCGATLKAPLYSAASLRDHLIKELRNAPAANILVEDMPEEKQRRVWNELFTSPLRGMKGNIGVLQLIADFVGILRGRDLKIVRTLAANLRVFIEDIPDPVSSDEEDYGDDDDDYSDYDYGRSRLYMY